MAFAVKRGKMRQRNWTDSSDKGKCFSPTVLFMNLYGTVSFIFSVNICQNYESEMLVSCWINSGDDYTLRTFVCLKQLYIREEETIRTVVRFARSSWVFLTGFQRTWIRTNNVTDSYLPVININTLEAIHIQINIKSRHHINPSDTFMRC